MPTQNILIIKPSSLGDIVHGLMIASEIKHARPEVHLTWVVRDTFAGLVERCEQIDSVLPYARNRGLRGLWDTCAAIRQKPYDVVLDLQGLARSALMTCFARAGRKIGRPDGREGSRLFYREFADRPEAEPAHAVDWLARFLSCLDIPLPTDWPAVRFRYDAQAVPSEAREAILLFPGSRRPEKEWPHYAALSRNLLQRGPGPVVWASDVAFPTPLDLADAGNFHNLTGQTGWDAFLGLIATARVVVANDSGPMHVAAAMGKPLVALFGPTDPRRFGPYPPGRPDQIVLRAPADTMAELTPDAVAQAVRDRLDP